MFMLRRSVAHLENCHFNQTSAGLLRRFKRIECYESPSLYFAIDFGSFLVRLSIARSRLQSVSIEPSEVDKCAVVCKEFTDPICLEPGLPLLSLECISTNVSLIASLHDGVVVAAKADLRGAENGEFECVWGTIEMGFMCGDFTLMFDADAWLSGIRVRS